MEADLQGIIDLFTCNQSGMEMSAIGFRLWIDYNGSVVKTKI